MDCSNVSKVKNNPTKIILTVKDNGKGCLQEKAKLLNRLTQLQIEEKKNHDSYHGLGLLIVKQVVELHHGKVVFYSDDSIGFQAEIHLPV